MTQTTDALSFRNGKLELSTNGSTWTNISGFSNAVTISGGERAIGALFTHDGDTPILTAGKRGQLEITVKAAYTEGGSDPTETVRAAYEAASALYVRWSPGGGGTGDFQYASAVGIVKNPTYPQGSVDNGDPITVDFVLVVASVTKSVVA